MSTDAHAAVVAAGFLGPAGGPQPCSAMPSQSLALPMQATIVSQPISANMTAVPQNGCGTFASLPLILPGSAQAQAFAKIEQKAAQLGIDRDRLSLAYTVGTLRLRMIQETAQRRFAEALAKQVAEVHQLQEKQQEAAQLALIMEAAEVQAEIAKKTLEEDKEDNEWRRRGGRSSPLCGNWQRGYCKHGDACQYAHPDREFASSSTKRGPADLMRHNFKTAVCRLHSQGTCAHGSRCMFAHGPSELRSPGALLSKDEEEMVQRVAAGGKRNKEAAERIASGAQAPCPTSGSKGSDHGPTVAQQVATAQMIALAGHAAASMPPLPGLAPTKAKSSSANPNDPNLNATQKTALAGLSRLGLDSSTLDMMSQLASGAPSTVEGGHAGCHVIGSTVRKVRPAHLPASAFAAIHSEEKRT